MMSESDLLISENALPILTPGDIIKCAWPIFGIRGHADDLSPPEWTYDIDVLIRVGTLHVVIRQLFYNHHIAPGVSPGSFLTLSCEGFVWMTRRAAFNLL